MTVYVALLRAVNVGGTGKLPMEQLRAMCVDAGFSAVRTYIASGNAVFGSDRAEQEVRSELETRLVQYAGKAVGVIVRTAREIAEVVARNPFAAQPGNRVTASFTDLPLPADPLADARGRKDEEVRLGERELFVFYPAGQADTRLWLPVMAAGTARNMNTIAKLAEIAASIG